MLFSLSLGGRVRYLLLLLLFAAQFANADAYKCKGENGKMVINCYAM